MELKNLSQLITPLLVGGSAFELGRGFSGGSDAWDGALDEIRIWNTARTEGDIQSTMNNSLQGNESGLTAYYKFDQTDPTIAGLPDRSTNQNDGTLVNFAGSAIWGTSGALSLPSLSVDYPNGGEVFEEDSIINITWTDNFNGSDLIEIRHSIDSGATSTILNDGTFDMYGGNYAWTVPNDYGSNNLIIIRNLTLGISDTSNAVFTINPPVISNYALEFDGTTQYVAVSDAPQFDIDTDWTIEAWIKTPSTGQQNIVTQVSGNTGYAFFKIGGTLYLQYYSSGGFQNGGTSLSVAAGIDDNQWHHVAVSQNGSNGKIYVDGVPVLDVNVLLPIDETTGDVRFGQDPFVGAYTGSLDEVRFWNYQLSDAEIASRFVTELNGDETGLMAYYPFNDGPPSSITIDETGNLNDGTLVGMDVNTDWVAGPALSPPLSGNPLGESFDTDLPTTTDQAIFLGSGLWEGQGVKSAENPALAIGSTGDAAYMFAGTGNYLTTPTLNGVNQFTFYYRAENAGGNGFVFDVFTSSDGGVTFDQQIANDSSNNTTTYQEFNYNFGSPYTGPIRIVYDALGSENGLIDDFYTDAEVIRPDVQISTLLTGNTTVNAGDQDVLIYKVQADISNAAAASEGLYLTIAGADSLDFELDGFKFYQNINVDDLGTATLLDSSSWSPGAPVPTGSIGQLFTDFYVPGTTVYFYVTADISASANPGTFSINLPDIEQFGFSDSNKFNAGLTAGSDITIQSPTNPDATMTTLSVTGATLALGSVDNLIYKFTISASGGDITKEGMVITLGGNATVDDFSANGWKLYESVNSDTGVGGATLIGSTNIGDVAPDTIGYAMSGDILNGNTHYFYITADVDTFATAGNTFNVVLWNGDPTESVGIADPKNKVDGGFVDGSSFTIGSPPDVTFATLPVTGGDLVTGSTDNVIYKFSIGSSGGDVTKEGIKFCPRRHGDYS